MHDQVRTGGDALDDVRAAAEAAVDDDLRPAAHSGDHLRQHGEGAAAVIQLAAAMVGDVDEFDAMGAGEGGVLRRADALEHERDAVLVLEALDVVPAECGLEAPCPAARVRQGLTKRLAMSRSRRE